MRFAISSAIDIVSLTVGVVLGVGMAMLGYGYWSLVAMTVVQIAVSTIAVWLVTRWIPGRPRRHVGISSMVRFGGIITLNSLVVYVAYNLEKVLLGRYWGADMLGIYGRAYQLANIPTENLNSSVGGVAFSALSRVKEDPQRFRSYFLKGYSIVLAFTLPITVVCTLYAEELVAVLLGPKWTASCQSFDCLPHDPYLRHDQPLRLAALLRGPSGTEPEARAGHRAPVIAGYVLGLPYGPTGVAFGYSAAMALWVVPHILWCLHGTVISIRDVALAVGRPMIVEHRGLGGSVGTEATVA